MEYDYNMLKEAGKVSSQALQRARETIRPGRKLLDIAEDLEAFIKGKGCELSFPVNLSINESAAHYTPEYSDASILPDESVLKVDLGARKGVYLTDCAITLSFSDKYSDLVRASEEALESAISLVRAGRPVNEIGREIGNVAKKHGVNPIRNLGGHGIEQDELHASVFIPNYDNGDATPLEEGQVIAIEPFMTTGEGHVVSGEHLQIFQKVSEGQLRSQEARDASAFIDKNYLTFPFATRWLVNGLGLGEFKARKAIAEMMNAGMLEPFPVLVERSGGMVSQHEKSLIVEKDSCAIVT